MPARALLFDLDGTLIDTNAHHVEAWCETLAAFGIALAPDLLAQEMGKGGDILVPTLLGPETEQKHGDAMRRAHGIAFKELLSRTAPRWLPGAREILADARRAGLRTALATSTGAADLAFLEGRLDVRFASLFDAVTTADDAERSKPEPDILDAAAKKLGVHPLACAMVGDSLHDATAARRAGMGFIGVTTGYVDAARFDEAGARFVTPTLVELAQELPAALDCAGRSRVAFDDPELERMMRVALQAADEGAREGEAPIGGAVFDADGRLLASGHNRAIASGDVSAHAEIDALRRVAASGKRLGTGATLVSTLEPCVMCLGAAMMASIDVVVFGLRAPADGGTRRVAAPRSPENDLPRVHGGVLAGEARRAFERWLAGSPNPKQIPYVEQLLRETARDFR